MKVIILSNSEKFKSEIDIVIRMFNSGLEVFHLRKPKFSYNRMREYIEAIPIKYHDRIMIHSHWKLATKYNLKGVHLTKRLRRDKLKTWWWLRMLKLKRPNICISTSFHSLLSMIEDDRDYTYVFLSPIFDSISKKGYGAAFSHDNLRATILKSKHNVIALGGVQSDRIQMARELGFDGVALLGSIWKKDVDPVRMFEEVRDIVEEKRLPPKDIQINPVKIQL